MPNPHTMLAALLALFLIAGAIAPASASEADASALVRCLEATEFSDDRARCIGSVAEPCLEQAADTSVACFDREATGWKAILDRAVAARRADDVPGIAKRIGPILDRWQALTEAKCGLFLDSTAYGDIGQQLAADCRMREAAGMALFVGYDMDG